MKSPADQGIAAAKADDLARSQHTHESISRMPWNVTANIGESRTHYGVRELCRCGSDRFVSTTLQIPWQTPETYQGVD
jgi:hypothetical protein